MPSRKACSPPSRGRLQGSLPCLGLCRLAILPRPLFPFGLTAGPPFPVRATVAQSYVLFPSHKDLTTPCHFACANLLPLTPYRTCGYLELFHGPLYLPVLLSTCVTPLYQILVFSFNNAHARTARVAQVLLAAPDASRKPTLGKALSLPLRKLRRMTCCLLGPPSAPREIAPLLPNGKNLR